MSEQLLKPENTPTGFGESHEAYRYRHLHPAVEKMGGWANYRHWFVRHGEDYFKTCELLEQDLMWALQQLSHKTNDPKTLRRIEKIRARQKLDGRPQTEEVE